MNENNLVEIPFYNALNKPPLFMGGEREPMMMVGLVSATLIFVALSPQSALLGISLWIVLSYLLREMAKKDPILSKIYFKSIKYKKYYPSLIRPVF